jgi:hypothetical protein
VPSIVRAIWPSVRPNEIITFQNKKKEKHPMIAKLKVVRSPQREALAQAIADARAAHEAAVKARDARKRANAMIVHAETKLGQATRAIERARDAQAANLAQAATSGVKPRADTGTREARIREADARDTLDAAKTALTTCEQTLAEFEGQQRRTEEPVARAADDVIRVEAASRVLKEAKVLQEKLIVARVALQYLHSKNLLPEPLMQEAKSLLAFREFASYWGNVEYYDWRRNDEYLRWSALHAELMKDADVDVLNNSHVK